MKIHLLKPFYLKKYFWKVFLHFFPIKTYGTYVCDYCFNFHTGWFQKHYMNGLWYQTTWMNREYCKVNKRLYKEAVINNCLPKYQQRYKKHFLRNNKCVRCGYKKT
jgi:hypothetical protein